MGCVVNGVSIDYDTYQDIYGGGLCEAEFAASCPGAARLVAWVLRGFGEVTEDVDVVAVKRAVCAATEVLAERGLGNEVGMKIGSYSTSASRADVREGRDIALEAVLEELGAGLPLFTGVTR